MSLDHPEWVNGRRIWMDGSVRELMNRIQLGDPVKGWEGDPRLELYFDGDRFELWRQEDDNEYRRVCRSQPGMSFDERIIDALIQWDGHRRTVKLVDEVNDHNARVDEANTAHREAWVAEELAPRLRNAFTKDL